MVEQVDIRRPEPELARPCRVMQPEDVEQGRLARARRPHDGDKVAFPDFEADSAQGIERASLERIDAIDVVELYHGSLSIARPVPEPRIGH